MTRRDAVALVGLIAGYLYGKPVGAAQGQAMSLVLDSVDVIVVQYRGRRVMVNPHELLDALGAAPPMPMQMPPMPSQFPRKN